MSERIVEILNFDGCPSIETAVARAREAIALANVPAHLRLVRVESAEDAERMRFLGSPSVRIDGKDVDPTAETRTDFGLQCRVYEVDGRRETAPPSRWIQLALRAGAPAASRQCRGS